MAEYIKRSELIKKAEQEAEAMSEPYKSTFAAMVDWLSAKVVPVNDVAPVRRGKKIPDGTDAAYCEWFKCSVCDDMWLTEHSNFCPNCGARMDGE